MSNCQMVLSKEQQKKDAEMQKNLDQDAVWKRIQQNTFLRWVNQHLSTVDKTIASLETDFADGIRFIALIEVLSGKKCPYKFSKRPTMRGHKVENVYVGLKFLTDDEGLKLVNIGMYYNILGLSKEEKKTGGLYSPMM